MMWQIDEEQSDSTSLDHAMTDIWPNVPIFPDDGNDELFCSNFRERKGEGLIKLEKGISLNRDIYVIFCFFLS